MKNFKIYALVALMSFLTASFLFREGGFGYPFNLFGADICTLSIPPQCHSPNGGIRLIYVLYDTIIWLLISFFLVNFYNEIRKNPQRLILYSVVSIIGFFIVSFGFEMFFKSNSFGMPFPIYTVPYDCRFYFPSDCYEGFLWQSILVDLLLWLIVSYIVVHLYKVIKANCKINFQLVNVLRKISSMGLIFGAVIGLVILIIIGLSFISGSMGQEAYCGGFTGKAVCPIGYYCPRSGYPDELKQCVSVLKFWKR